MLYDEVLAMSQGWLLANDGKRFQIQRFDADPEERYACDDEALAAVYSLVNTLDDEHARFCLSKAGYIV